MNIVELVGVDGELRVVTIRACCSGHVGDHLCHRVFTLVEMLRPARINIVLLFFRHTSIFSDHRTLVILLISIPPG